MQLIATLSPPGQGNNGYVGPLAFSPDGHMLAIPTLYNGVNHITTYLWDLGAEG
jgi:hypothetical protein